MNYINRLSNYFFIINLFSCLAFIRLPDLISFPILRFILYFLFLLGCIFGLVSIYPVYKKLTLSILFFICSIFIHAFSNFYQPSLKPGISVQNYILQENITSDFEMTQTRLYMMFFVLFLFPSIYFFYSLFSSKCSEKYSKVLIISFLSCNILNCLTAFYQGIWNLNFLAQGSGSSVIARRPPGLLDDSGIASFFFAISGSLFFALFFDKRIHFKFKINIFLLFILNLFSGILNDSRSFYIGLFGTIFIYFIYKLIYFIINKKYKLLINLFSISILIIFSINFLSKYINMTALTRLKNINNSLDTSNSFFNYYSFIDYQRAAHLQIMWETIKEYFFTGTGLGSFASNFYYQLSILKFNQSISLDIPTNTFFAIISELGIVGLLLVLFSFFLYIFYISKDKNNPVLSKKIHYQTIFSLIPIWGGVSFLILGLVSYMFYMPSTSYIACLIISPCLLTFLNDKKTNEKFVSLFFCVMSAYLIIVSLYLAITAPPVPAFHWKQRGIPQVPMPVGSLPQPDGHTEKGKLYFSNLINQIFGGNDKLLNPNGASEGRWFKPKTDFLIQYPEYRIYVGPESRVFPIKITITFYSKNGDTLQNYFLVEQASWVYFSIPKQKEFEPCFHSVSSSTFCYYHVSVSPAWEPSFLNSIGFYIENKYINLQNPWR